LASPDITRSTSTEHNAFRASSRAIAALAVSVAAGKSRAQIAFADVVESSATREDVSLVALVAAWNARVHHISRRVVRRKSRVQYNALRIGTIDDE
jgi:hypothetical protein